MVDASDLKKCPGPLCNGALRPKSEFNRNRTRPSGIQAICRSCQQSRELVWRDDNREKYNAKRSAWLRAHPAQRALDKQNRLDRLAQAPGGEFDWSRADYQQRIAEYNFLCAYCSGPYQALDHVLPVSRGGGNEAANIVPACIKCNTSKGRKTLAEWHPESRWYNRRKKIAK